MSGLLADSGRLSFDAAVSADAGRTSDAGRSSASDAGDLADGGSTHADAGSAATDAGRAVVDAGSSFDAGRGDSGLSLDGGSGLDAGAAFDGGPSDAGQGWPVVDGGSSAPQPTGAVYYVSLDGHDSNSCAQATSPASAKATFASAWACVNAGDGLVIRDGVYHQDLSPPAGKSGEANQVIVVSAEHDGAVEIVGGLGLRNNSYLAFVGLTVTGDSSAIALVSAGTGKVSHHNGFYRVGFNCTVTVSDNACLGFSDGSHHNLVEDSWGWGGGRYIVLVYGGPGGNPPNVTADFNTFRRLVLRQGPHQSSGGNPQAGLALYYASNNTVENVIVVDSVPASDTSNSAFYLTGHAAPPSTSNNVFVGDLALNNLGTGWYLDHNGTGSNNELRDSVIWGSDHGVALYADGTCSDNVVDHVTIAQNGGTGLWNGCDATKITSSIVWGNQGVGLSQGGGAGSIALEEWNLVAANAGGARNGVTAGVHDLSNDPGLLYVPRVEASSPCVGAGQNGSTCGGSLRVRSVGGVPTTTPLWPWPYETRIKKELCAGSNATRGFCKAASLTDYVWSYLGHPPPPSF